MTSNHSSRSQSWLARALVAVLLWSSGQCEVDIGVNGDVSDDRIPVVISSDPGVDDTFAILTALASPKLNVLGIASSFGCHASPLVTANNAKFLLDFVNRSEVPVHVGTPFMLGRTEEFVSAGEFWHGKGGFGGVKVPQVLDKEYVSTSLSASEFIVKMAREYPGKLCILSFAPMTNIAMAVSLEPRLNQFVKHLYVMGGAVDSAGNVSPIAEANFGDDSIAARIAVQHFSGKITIAPLDVTHKVLISHEERSRCLQTRVGEMVYNLSSHYARMYKSIRGDDMPLHDTHAVLALIAPSVFTRVEQRLIEIATDRVGDAINGAVIVERRPNAPDRGIGSLKASGEATVILDADGAAFRRTVCELISTL